MTGSSTPAVPGSSRRWRPWRRGRADDVRSFRRQLILSTAALGAVVAAALVLVVQFTIGGSATDAVDQILTERAATVAAAVKGASSGTTLTVPAAQLEAGVVVYDADGTLVAGYVPPPLGRYFAGLSTVSTTRTHRIGDAYQLRAVPFATGSGARGVVVVYERLDPYEDDQHDAIAIAIAAGAIIVLFATALAAWASRRALAPVATMARTAQDWSAHDLDRRFDLGPPTNEIRALGQTLDDLLDKVVRAILTEQRLTSELAHELRTPLTAIHGTAELIALRQDLDPQLREDVEDILRGTRAMAGTITSLLSLARMQSSQATSADADLATVLEEALLQTGSSGQVLVHLQAPVRVAVAPDLAVRTIAPVLENAVRLADQVSVSVHAEEAGSLVRITVRDNGPGVATEELDAVFVPGHTSGPGSGLGLPLARRIARSVGGDVTLDPCDGTGASFTVSLPAVR